MPDCRRIKGQHTESGRLSGKSVLYMFNTMHKGIVMDIAGIYHSNGRHDQQIRFPGYGGLINFMHLLLMQWSLSVKPQHIAPPKFVKLITHIFWRQADMIEIMMYGGFNSPNLTSQTGLYLIAVPFNSGHRKFFGKLEYRDYEHLPRPLRRCPAQP